MLTPTAALTLLQQTPAGHAVEHFDFTALCVQRFDFVATVRANGQPGPRVLREVREDWQAKRWEPTAEILHWRLIAPAGVAHAA